MAAFPATYRIEDQVNLQWQDSQIDEAAWHSVLLQMLA